MNINHTRYLIFLNFLLICSNALSQNLATPLLEKSLSFYQKYETKKQDLQSLFQKDEFNYLPSDDLQFLKSRIKIYGLAPFSVKGNSMIISLDTENTLEIDYQSINLSTLIIRGIPYTFNLNQPLKSLYEVDYKKALKKFKSETSSLWHFVLFPLSLSGCENSGSNFEKATNSSSLPLAYLRVCAECATIAFNPTGTLIGTGLALSQGAYVGIKDKSWKAGGAQFCESLPGLGGFLNLYHANKSKNQNQIEHSK